MKHLILRGVLLTLLATLLLTLAACKDPNPPREDPIPPASSADAEYTVTVQDSKGTVLSGVVVNFNQNGAVVKMALTGADGTVKATLPRGDYSITFTAPDVSYDYESEKCVLSATVTALNAVLYTPLATKMELYNDYTAYVVDEGVFRPVLAQNDMTYFVFIPSRAGVYKISATADKPLDLGNYGAPTYIWSEKIDPSEDGTIKFEVHNYNVGETPQQTTHYLFGIHTGTTGLSTCILNIEHTGMPALTPEDLPWNDLQPEAGIKPADFVHYLNWKPTFHNLPVTDPNLTVVFNEDDGFYHYDTANGPVVMIRITSPSPYLPSFTEICESDPLRAYIYDEEGNFVRKEGYLHLINAYAAICNKDGVCPLTKQLEYVMKTCGDYKFWWDFGKGMHIFGEDIVEADTAWLFACGYYTVEKNGATLEAPAALGTEGAERVLIAGDTTLHFTANAMESATLTVTGLCESDTVTFAGTTYQPANGTVTVSIPQTGDKFFSITHAGTAEIELTLTLA